MIHFAKLTKRGKLILNNSFKLMLIVLFKNI